MDKSTEITRETILEICDNCNKNIANNCKLREYGEFCMPILLLFEKLENLNYCQFSNDKRATLASDPLQRRGNRERLDTLPPLFLKFPRRWRKRTKRNEQ